MGFLYLEVMKNMKIKISVIISAVLLVSSAQAANLELSFKIPTKKDPVQPRVIALSPSITEMVYALGFEKNLVGTSDFSDYPLEAKKLPSVGAYSKPDMEKILSLKPDLILVPSEGSEETAIKLDRLKLKTEIITIKKLNDIGDSAVIIAMLMGDKAKGTKFRKDWDDSIQKLKKKYKDLELIKHGEKPKEKTALLSVQSEPLIVAGNHTFLNESLELCGGQNVFDERSGYPRISSEEFISRSFEKLLLVEHFNSDAERAQAIGAWKERFKKFNLPENEIHILDPDTTSRPGPRLLIGVEKICKIIRDLPIE